MRRHREAAGRDGEPFGEELLTQFERTPEDAASALLRWRDAGGSHASVQTTKRGLGPELDAHLAYLEATVADHGALLEQALHPVRAAAAAGFPSPVGDAKESGTRTIGSGAGRDMTYVDYEMLKVSSEGGVVRVSFNRPEVKNATNVRMQQELVRIFRDIRRDPAARVVILTGEGSAFSAGGDISSLDKSLEDHIRWNESMIEAADIVNGIIDLDVPVIARVNGHAIGLGATLALFCDIVIADRKAKIGDPHVGLGLVAGDGGAIIWPALVGYARAKKYLLTGDAITGAEAAEIGLVSEAVDAEELDARVAYYADRFVNGASVAIRFTKRAVNLDLKARVDAMMQAHLGLETMSHLSADHREAVMAFLEKRKPRFTGK